MPHATVVFSGMLRSMKAAPADTQIRLRAGAICCLLFRAGQVMPLPLTNSSPSMRTPFRMPPLSAELLVSQHLAGMQQACCICICARACIRAPIRIRICSCSCSCFCICICICIRAQHICSASAAPLLLNINARLEARRCVTSGTRLMYHLAHLRVFSSVSAELIDTRSSQRAHHRRIFRYRYTHTATRTGTGTRTQRFRPAFWPKQPTLALALALALAHIVSI